MACQVTKRLCSEEIRMVSLIEYIRYAENLYNSSQGRFLARALSLCDEHVNNENLINADLRTVAAICFAPLDELLVNHLLALKAINLRNFAEAYNHQAVYIEVIVNLMERQTGTNWMLPVMYTSCTDLRMVAEKADVASEGTGAFVERASAGWIACFKVCVEDIETPLANSKLVGLLTPANLLLKMYFKMRKFYICNTIIKLIEPVITRGPFLITDLVTFRFYIGRMALLEGDFHKANKNLTYSYRHCYSFSYKNKRVIVSYLMPVKLLLGYMPSRHMIERYNLPIYWNLVTAVREGQIRAFERIMLKHERFFANTGLYDALDSLRLVAYRNVLKKIYRSMNTNTLALTSIQTGLRLMADTEVELMETQSIVTAMIFNNKIQAYMSAHHQAVIFNPYNPFPSLSAHVQPHYY